MVVVVVGHYVTGVKSFEVAFICKNSNNITSKESKYLKVCRKKSDDVNSSDDGNKDENVVACDDDKIIILIYVIYNIL